MAVCALAMACAQVARADADFSDAGGDGGGAPDVTDVSIWNDAFGRIVLGVKIAGGAGLAADGEIVFVIDSDQNVETGSGGWDYLAVIMPGDRWNFFAWDGAQWVEAPGKSVKVYSWDDVMLFAVDRSELGNTAAFGFFVQANKLAGEDVAASDVAPEGDAFWSYATVTKTFGIAASPVVAATKGGAKAGKPFTAGYVFGRTDSPEPATAPRTTCTATLQGKRLAAKASQDAEVAACRVVLPKTAKGKTLKLTLTTTSGGKSVKKSYTTKVR